MKINFVCTKSNVGSGLVVGESFLTKKLLRDMGQNHGRALPRCLDNYFDWNHLFPSSFFAWNKSWSNQQVEWIELKGTVCMANAMVKNKLEQVSKIKSEFW